MKLTKEQITTLASRLNTPWASVKLLCDGHRITLRAECWKALNYRVMTYIDGEFKGAWFNGRKEHPQQKFMRKSVRPNLSAAKRLKLEKALGKRRVAEDSYLSGSVTLYCPDWANGKAALNHLNKACDSIEVVLEAGTP